MIRSAGHREKNGLRSRPSRSSYGCCKSSRGGPASHLSLRITCHVWAGPAAAGGLANGFLPRGVQSLLGRRWIPSRTLSHTSAQIIKLKMAPVCVFQDEPAEHCLFHTCIFYRCGARLTFNFKQAEDCIRLRGGSLHSDAYSPARILPGAGRGAFPASSFMPLVALRSFKGRRVF